MTLLPKQLQPSSIHERGRSAKGDNIPSNIKVTQEKNGLSVGIRRNGLIELTIDLKLQDKRHNKKNSGCRN